MKTYLIEIFGTVQGVGFRPFVYRLANDLGVFGWVKNDANGVQISLNCTEHDLSIFLNCLETQKPPLSKIEKISFYEVEHQDFSEFVVIHSSKDGKKITFLPPDCSICEDCERELRDTNDRRFGYPFISCTNCGVRYSMIKKLPYDRQNSSMCEFEMCESCRAEYENPADRRYYAQTIGCFDCGPTLSAFDNNFNNLDFSIKLISDSLNDGKIIAIKSVGGYHLICDATNEHAINELRNRKKRSTKPFAVMVKDIEMAKEIANINKKEEEILKSIARPIVVLEQKKVSILSNLINPKIDKIGLFLPFTPLHILILEKFQKPIVATSANLSGDPLARNFNEIKMQSFIWDILVEHDREIVNSVDDSVVFELNGGIHFLRRARGYAPSNIKLSKKLSKNVLCVGANQKSTIAIAFDDNVVMSPHIGDLGSILSLDFFEKNIDNLKSLYDFTPDMIICDKNSSYESSKWARNQNIPLFELQHHKAHILAVIDGLEPIGPYLGIAFDGTGLGDDGTIWGGEFFMISKNNFERIGFFEPFELLGIEMAIKEPRRVALSLLFDIFGHDALNLQNNTINSFDKSLANNLFIAWEKKLNTIASSSCGRIFDAVASILGLLQISSYEGEAGLILESYFDPSIDGRYNFHITQNGIISIKPMILDLLDEQDINVAVSKFFNTIIEIIVYFANQTNLPIVFCGGVFQNKTICNLIYQRKLNGYFSYNLPSNDGSIAYGQAVYALNI